MGKQRASPEKELQKSILSWLGVKYPGILVWKQNSTATFSFQKKTFLKPDKYTMKGISDIIGIFPSGVWLAIEVKWKPSGKKPSVDQLNFQAHIVERSGIAFVAWSIEDVESKLKEVISRHPHLIRQGPRLMDNLGPQVQTVLEPVLSPDPEDLELF